MKKAIFYEGDYDREVLNAIIADLPAAPTLICAKSKYGMKSFIQGRISVPVLGLNDSNVMAFRDRDFDFPVPENEGLIIPEDNGRPDRKVRASYRTTIENYLLTPANMFAFCENHDTYRGQFTLGDLRGRFEHAAREILYYQAARHALGAIRTVAKQETKWVSDSGTLPTDLGIDGCIQAAYSLIDAYNNNINSYNRQMFQEKFDQFRARFEEPAFLENEAYLVYFQGKDVETALAQHLPAQFPFKFFYRETLKTFNYRHFPDLIQLRTLITT